MTDRSNETDEHERTESESDDGDAGDLETWTVPVVDLETGEDFEVAVQATSAYDAMCKAPNEYAVTRAFIEQHVDIDVPSPEDLDVEDLPDYEPPAERPEGDE